jgi:hypothetical protein
MVTVLTFTASHRHEVNPRLLLKAIQFKFKISLFGVGGISSYLLKPVQHQTDSFSDRNPGFLNWHGVRRQLWARSFQDQMAVIQLVIGFCCHYTAAISSIYVLLYGFGALLLSLGMTVERFIM